MKTPGVIYIIYYPGSYWEIYMFFIHVLMIFIFLISAFYVPFLLNI